MTQLTQGLIVAVLIGLLLAVIVGYYLRQGQVSELTEALEQSQKRQQDLELEHEQRLRDATQQLQQDYEAQLAEKIEQYQAQTEQQRSQLEAEFLARQSLIGDAAPEHDSTTEQRIRKQYETRLKEAATKIQQAYEHHLQEKLIEARSLAQQDYDQRLAAAIARYQDDSQARLGQNIGNVPLSDLVPEPSAGAIASSTNLAAAETRLQAEYDQRLAERIAEYQDDISQRMAQLEQDYEARLRMAQASAPAVSPTAAEPSMPELELNLRRELEASLREEYEQKLAEKIEHYQDELTQRTQELEQSYESRLQLLQTAPAQASNPGAGVVDRNTEIATTYGVAMDTDLDSEEPDLDLASLLDGDIESDPESGLDLDSDFDTESLDLEALLNAPTPETDSDDDLLDSLDDISDLS